VEVQVGLRHCGSPHQAWCRPVQTTLPPATSSAVLGEDGSNQVRSSRLNTLDERPLNQVIGVTGRRSLSRRRFFSDRGLGARAQGVAIDRGRRRCARCRVRCFLLTPPGAYDPDRSGRVQVEAAASLAVGQVHLDDVTYGRVHAGDSVAFRAGDDQVAGTHMRRGLHDALTADGSAGADPGKGSDPRRKGVRVRRATGSDAPHGRPPGVDAALLWLGIGGRRPRLSQIAGLLPEVDQAPLLTAATVSGGGCTAA
jgi:hypothetical protein